MEIARKSVTELVLDQLHAWGVRRVYGVVGDAILPLISQFSSRSDITFIPVRHEEAAVFMAKADAQISGSLGVCVATSGPGAAHLVNGLADAKTDSAPVLAITGQVESYYVGTVHKQTIDQQQLFGAVTDYSVELSNPGAVTDVLGRAIRVALGQSTAVHISIPKDFWSSIAPTSSIQPYAPYLKTTPRSSEDVIRVAAERIAAAERPAILAGAGTRGAVGPVLQLAEHLTAPVIYSLASAGQFPGEHHLVLGGIGEGGADSSSRVLAESDCILRLGTTWWPQEYAPEHTDVIDVNTRTDHLGMGAWRAYGIAGPAEEIVPKFLHVQTSPRPYWERRIWDLRSAWNNQLAREAADATPPREPGIHPAFTVATLTHALPQEAIITLDVGEHVLWFNRHFRGNGRQDVLVSGYWRSMGFGLPAAIGAQLAAPDRPVVAFVGDGGVAMVLAELLTAVRLKLPIVVVILNNQSLAMEAHEMERMGLAVHGISLNNPDFAAYAKLCRADGYRVERGEELAPALNQALQRRTTAVVDVISSNVPLPLPMKLEPAAEPVGV